MVPQGTVSELFEATEQPVAVTAVPPLSVIPAPPLLRAMMQPVVFTLSSAYEADDTDREVEPPSTDAR